MSAESKRARRDKQIKKKQPPSGKTKAIQIAIAVVGLIVLVGAVRMVWNNMLPPAPPSLTETQTKTLNDAIATKGYDAPYSVVLDANRQLIVTFILDEPKSPTYLKGFAMDRMATVREAFGKKSPAKSYRVNISASAMDPDMMIRWGHAIYDKGDSVEWVAGK
jgi:hypothetical protein